MRRVFFFVLQLEVFLHIDRGVALFRARTGGLCGASHDQSIDQTR